MINVPVISFRISEKLKKEMAELDINWPEFIRKTIEKQVELEKRRKASSRIDELRKKTSGFPFDSTVEIRRLRESG